MNQRRSRHEAPKQEESLVTNYVRPVAIGMGIGVVVLALFLLLFSLILSIADIPEGLIWPVTLLSLSAGAFTSGLVTARLVGEHGLFYGFCCGILMCILILITTLITGQSYFSLTGIYKFLCAIVFAIIGGVVGVNGRRRRK